MAAAAAAGPKSKLQRLIESENFHNSLRTYSVSEKPKESSSSSTRQPLSEMTEMQMQVADYKVKMARSEIRTLRDAKAIKDLSQKNEVLQKQNKELFEIVDRAADRIHQIEVDCKENHVKMPSDVKARDKNAVRQVADKAIRQEIWYRNKENVRSFR